MADVIRNLLNYSCIYSQYSKADFSVTYFLLSRRFQPIMASILVQFKNFCDVSNEISKLQSDASIATLNQSFLKMLKMKLKLNEINCVYF